MAQQIDGYYIRIADPNSAEIKISRMMHAPSNYYRITGTALAGGRGGEQPAQGTLDFISHIQAGRHFHFDEPPYRLHIEFTSNGDFVVNEPEPQHRHQKGVTFRGVYRKA